MEGGRERKKEAAAGSRDVKMKKTKRKSPLRKLFPLSFFFTVDNIDASLYFFLTKNKSSSTA